MVRRLCGALGPEPVFLGLAGALQEEADLAFASTMVQVRGLGGGRCMESAWHAPRKAGVL